MHRPLPKWWRCIYATKASRHSLPDGEHAQPEIKAVFPDAILLGWMLPGESGLSLARKSRVDARTGLT
jgi:DNA-binding response OmpR family regulator